MRPFTANHNSTKAAWKTLGVSSQSRIWVTLDASRLFKARKNATTVRPLTLGGQHSMPLAAYSRLTPTPGRLFVRIRRIVELGAVLLGLDLAASLLMRGLEQTAHWIVCMPLEAAAILSWLLGLFACVLWYKSAHRVVGGATVYGLVACSSMTFAWTLWQASSPILIPSQYLPKRSPLKSPRNNSLAFIGISSQQQSNKRLVRAVYRCFKKLSFWQGQQVSTTAAASLEQPLHRQCSGALPKLGVSGIQLLTTRLPNLSQLPALELVLSEQTKLTALRLFQWQNAHAANPGHLRSTLSLWHVHKILQPRFQASGLAKLSMNPRPYLTDSSLKGPYHSWLASELPFTTYVQEPCRYPIRYDYLQTLKLSELSMWSRPKNTRTVKFNLKRVLRRKNTQ